MTIDVKEIIVLKVKKPVDTAPLLQNDRTFVPLRFISEGLGAEVNWEAATRTVRITDSGGDKYRIGDFVIDIGPNDKVDINTRSLMSIVKESGLIIGEGTGTAGPCIIIQIKADIPTTDVPKQREEVAALLKQRVGEKNASEIMVYAAHKQTRYDEIALRIFDEEQYSVYVSGTGGPITITIYMN